MRDTCLEAECAYTVYVVQSGENHERWIKVGRAYENEDGNGFTIEHGFGVAGINSLNGKIVLRREEMQTTPDRRSVIYPTNRYRPVLAKG